MIAALIGCLVVFLASGMFFNHVTGLKFWTLTLVDLFGLLVFAIMLMNLILLSWVWSLGLVSVVVLYLIVRFLNKGKLPPLVDPIIGGRKEK